MIGIIADVHLANHRQHGGPIENGVNHRAMLILDTMRRAYKAAENVGCETLVVAGDLFDTPNPEPQIVRAAQLAIPNAVVMPGNHDMVSTGYGDHALGPLRPTSRIVEKWKDLEGPPSYRMIPYDPEPITQWLPKALEGNVYGDGTAILHAGIADDSTPAYLRGPDAIHVDDLITLCEAADFHAVFAGHWHFYGVKAHQPLIVQVGALCPTGWDNPGLEGHGSLILWNGESFERLEIPGPRFVEVTAVEEELQRLQAMREAGHNLFVRVKDSKEAPDFQAEVSQHVESCSIVLDDRQARAAARAAAVVARSASTLDGALEAYVSKMDLDEDVDRAEVLATSKRYLEGA